MKKFRPLIGLILILQILAFLTSYFVTKSAVNGWYQGIHKSALNPPDWLFAPVWTILYTLLAIALWHLWRGRKNPVQHKALILLTVQMVLNYLWSPVFFGMGAFGAAFIIIVCMVALTLGVIFMTWPVKRVVAYLLVPYLAWIAFASHLNYAIMSLN